jgi:integrase
LRRRTGVVFGPHHFRHTYATWLLRRGAGMESVKELLGHASITTTIDAYGKARELHQTGEKPQVARSACQRNTVSDHRIAAA